MKISEAMERAKSLTGNSSDNTTLCRWLSELDGRLMLDFYHGSEWMTYATPQDDGKELLVPFPWDDLYVHYLEAMVYYTNGEYERYRNSYTLYNQKELEYRKWLQRNHIPITLEAVQKRDCAIVTEGCACQPFWYLSAYGVAVKHGFEGSEDEWLETLEGQSVEFRYSGGWFQWRHVGGGEPDGEWNNAMSLEDIQEGVVADTLAEAQGYRDEAKQSADAAGKSETAAAGSADNARGSAEAAGGFANKAEGEAGKAETARAGAEAKAREAAEQAAEAKSQADLAKGEADRAGTEADTAGDAAALAEKYRDSIYNMEVSAKANEQDAGATVDKEFTDDTVHLTFGLPKGDKGGQGPKGDDATINGYTAVTITASEPLLLEQTEGTLNFTARPYRTFQVSLPLASWESGSQTVTAEGVIADELKQVVWISPASASYAAWNTYGIQCTGQGEGELAFTCAFTPDADVTVNVALAPIGGDTE